MFCKEICKKKTVTVLCSAETDFSRARSLSVGPAKMASAVSTLPPPVHCIHSASMCIAQKLMERICK